VGAEAESESVADVLPLVEEDTAGDEPGHPGRGLNSLQGLLPLVGKSDDDESDDDEAKVDE
jgi:hypothetical protein